MDSSWIPFGFYLGSIRILTLDTIQIPFGICFGSRWSPLGFHLVSDCIAFAFQLDPAPGRAPVGYHAGSIGVQFWVLLA